MKTSRARELRKSPTKAEGILWSRLRRRQVHGFKFRRQRPIGDYIVDFVCLEKYLVIGVDGGQHASQTEYDELRTRRIEEQGFRVLRFWNNHVIRETTAVLDTIGEALLSK